jgi:zinc/manganese transport system permease protein
MIEALTFMAAPFLACLVLVAILGYLGLHVLLRGVVFVDLALAQIAALGTLVAFLFHHEPGSPAAFGFSLGAALLGALIFSVTRNDRGRVPQEAIIGITYVIASAFGILLADRAPEGAEHIKEMLAGAIVWVTWPTVIRNLLVVAVVGAVHFAVRRQLIAISEQPEEAARQGLGLKRWDFVFYATFALVVTLAVEIAGVLMVFAYLVTPAIIALRTSSRWSVRILVAWLVGVVATAVGLGASYRWDFPSGPAVVCTLGLILLAHSAGRVLRGQDTDPEYTGPAE